MYNIHCLCLHNSYRPKSSTHAAMFSQLQQMDEQLDAIENTAKKLDGEFQNSNQVCNLYHYMYHT